MSRRPRALLGVLLALALATAACGDDDGGGEDATGDGASDGNTDDTDAADAEEPTPITVGILPLAGLAPLYHGVEEGFFAEEGLDVSMEVGQGGAALTPAVLTNDYQFAVGEYMSLMQARQNNVGIRVVSNLTNAADAADQGINALLVAPDSDIDSIEDLAGTTIAVNGLGGIEEVTIRAMLDEHGVDHSDIRFTEVPFPDMNAAVDSGEVDVAAQPEPFVTLGEQAGLVNLLDPFYEAVPGMPLGLVFASEEWLEENPELASAFHRALRRSIEAASDEDLMREVIVDNTEIEPDVVEEMALDHWVPEVDRDKLELVGELATRYGVLEEEPDLDELVWSP